MFYEWEERFADGEPCIGLLGVMITEEVVIIPVFGFEGYTTDRYKVVVVPSKSTQTLLADGNGTGREEQTVRNAFVCAAKCAKHVVYLFAMPVEVG